MSEETKKTSFFKGVKAEFKKISWPNKNDLTKETIAVLFVSVMLGIIITVIDFIAKAGIEFIIK